jgi:thiamine-phosphate pyrophosphorylase
MHDLSPAAERALDTARLTSQGDELHIGRLFLALTDDPEGRGAELIVSAGGRLEVVRRRVETQVDLTFKLAELLRGAKDAAGERMETTITGEFLLLGLVKEAESLRQTLDAAGVQTGFLLGNEELPTIELGMSLEAPLPDDEIATHRILDAAANRVREALRVLDDYCRFVLNDAILTEQIKSLRHDFVDTISRLDERTLIVSRETQTDVGTAIVTSSEMLRTSPRDVATVNLKRLQEALRSLEEFGKLADPGFAARIEQIRYRTYTIDKALSLGADSRERLRHANLYVLLTGSTCLASLEWTIHEAAAGGADLFQLREKDLSDREFLQRARDVRRWTRQTQTLFLINDRPDIARLCEADGVHLGQDDLSVADARKILGPHAIIGVSTHDEVQLRQAILDGANYVGLGPTFPSTTKSFDAFPGLDFLRKATAQTSLPAFAIGGITAGNVAEVYRAGATRIAVGAAIARADDPQAAARNLKFQR